SGTGNRGFFNSGTGNTGIGNAGDYNTGIGNTSIANTGIGNTGSFNTGIGNTGNHNTGSFNVGSFNTGDANPGSQNTGSFNGGNTNTGFANAGDLNTGSFNTGSMNVGSFQLADSQVLDGFNISIDFPAIPIDLVAGTNVAIPITGQFDPITIYPIIVDVPVNVTGLGLATISGTVPSAIVDPIVINPIRLMDVVYGADVQIPIQMTLLGRLDLSLPGVLGIGNSLGSLASGFFNGVSNGTSGFLNTSDLSSGFVNANGALTSGWLNAGSLLTGSQNLGDAISGFVNTSTVAGDAVISGIGNIGSQISGFLHGQMSALQQTLTDWVTP
ncbi:pentapeptide repeat-containing protein, partial [Mycobacterium kiyosense]